jgi:hypothetical protein
MLSLIASVLIAASSILTTKSGGCPTVTHVPVADVQYQEGVDAKGLAVAPADLAPPVLSKQDFERVNIPLNIPLENYPAQKPDFAKTDGEWNKQQQAQQSVQGQKPSTPTYNADLSQSWIQPGLVSVNTQTGDVTMDGKKLAAPEAAELNPDCW